MSAVIPGLPLFAQHLVRIHQRDDGTHSAEVVGLAELNATAPTRAEAISRVSDALQHRLRDGQLVVVNTPLRNPLMEWFGHAKTDESFQDYLDEIQRYRRELDDRTALPSLPEACSSTSSTPTT